MKSQVDRLLRYWLCERRGLLRRIAQLETALVSEQSRNREREDALVNCVLTASGRYGIEPRKPEPSLRPEPKPRQSTLNALQAARLQAWKEDAIRHGVSVAEAERDFWRELEAQQNDNAPQPYPPLT